MTVNPASLPAGGGPVVVDATVTNAMSVTLNGNAVTLPATINVAVSELLTLVATGPGGTAMASVSVTVAGSAPPPPVPPANYQGLWWASGGTEPGWGINFAQSDYKIYAVWYTYDTGGNPLWMSMLGNWMSMRTSDDGDEFTGPVYAGNELVGTGTLIFSDIDDGTFTYSLDAGAGGSPVAVSQTKSISRYDLFTGPRVACAYDPAGNLALATNYQDLWWSVDGVELDWGINIAHQGDSLFLTWFGYFGGGAPQWLSGLAQRVGTSNSYTGLMYFTSGPRFDAYNASDLVLPIPVVGTATLVFADGNNAAFNFTTNGNGGLPEGMSQTRSLTRFPLAATGGTVCF
jgi:hypothetical protein